MVILFFAPELMNFWPLLYCGFWGPLELYNKSKNFDSWPLDMPKKYEPWAALKLNMCTVSIGQVFRLKFFKTGGFEQITNNDQILNATLYYISLSQNLSLFGPMQFDISEQCAFLKQSSFFPALDRHSKPFLDSITVRLSQLRGWLLCVYVCGRGLADGGKRRHYTLFHIA